MLKHRRMANQPPPLKPLQHQTFQLGRVPQFSGNRRTAGLTVEGLPCIISPALPRHPVRQKPVQQPGEQVAADFPAGILAALTRQRLSLPAGAAATVVGSRFALPLLSALGFVSSDVLSPSPSSDSADYCVRKGSPAQSLYLKVLGGGEDLASGAGVPYCQGFLRLTRFLTKTNSQPIQWGVVTNARHIQVFRRHGQVVHPVTPCLSLEGNLKAVLGRIQQAVNVSSRALTITVFNPKGGVGKTATVLNLATTLAMVGKRVLVMDLASGQGNLGDALNLLPRSQPRRSCSPTALGTAISQYRLEHPDTGKTLEFDAILADDAIAVANSAVVRPDAICLDPAMDTLRRAIAPLQSRYDYILIDTPPDWRRAAQAAVQSADVVLVPVGHDNRHSLQSAATVAARLIPEVCASREAIGEAGPIALPIVMNSFSNMAGPQRHLMHQAIAEIIEETKAAHRVDLTPYFYPNVQRTYGNLGIPTIPRMACFTKADFMRLPAAFIFRPAFGHYLGLAKAYLVD